MTQAVTLAQLASSGAITADTSGNVGIGTSTPNASYKVSITSSSAGALPGMLITDTNAGGGIFAIYSAGNSLQFRDVSAGSTRMQIDSRGNLVLYTNQLTLGSGTIKQYTGGVTSLATTFTTDVVIQSQAGGLLIAQLYHYGNIGYGASRVSVVSVGPGGLAENNIQNATTGFGGSWSFARLNDTTVRVTKTGGSYAAGTGYWSITFLGN